VESFVVQYGNGQYRDFGMEIELKSVLRYLPIGVYTHGQLRRELKRCADLGKPWPFVLAVIPHSANKQRSLAPRIHLLLKSAFAWRRFAAPIRLVESPIMRNVAGNLIRTE
jgi:hypothetical protein